LAEIWQTYDKKNSVEKNLTKYIKKYYFIINHPFFNINKIGLFRNRYLINTDINEK
jgi:prephenate dehydrogenase